MEVKFDGDHRIRIVLQGVYKGTTQVCLELVYTRRSHTKRIYSPNMVSEALIKSSLV